MTWTEFVVAFVAPGTTTFVVIGASVIFLKDRAAKFADSKIELMIKRNELAIKHHHDEELELLKSGQNRINEQLKTQYSWLYVERAKAMLEIHANIVSTERANLEAVTTLGRTADDRTPLKTRQRIAEEKLTEFAECHRSLVQSFEYRRLLFDKDVSENIEKLTGFYKESARLLRRIIDGRDQPIVPDELNALGDNARSQRAAYDEAKQLIEKKFRMLYGTLE
jgi:hypothetical protein